MAKKATKNFECSECGYTTQKWAGKCPSCESWSSFVEVESAEPKRGLSGAKGMTEGNTPIALSDVQIDETIRLQTANPELDRTLGGGLAPGSLILIGGDPGIGKSTLLLQTVATLSAAGEKVLYVSGEESAEQVKLRSSRLEVAGSDMMLYCETDLDKIIQTAKKEKPAVMVIDSIQTMFRPELNGTPGSVSQLRECTLEFMVNAKSTGCITILVGHVTKEGNIAGPRILEHMVDTVIYFEGDNNHQFRMLRSIKNRFGATDEVGVFEMTAKGLMPVANPSMIFVQGMHTDTPGSMISCNMEGSRALMFEVQALVSSTTYSVAQRVAMGVDPKRLTIILALLEKFAGMQIGNSDVFASIAGGLKVNDPGLDLALALAIASNHMNKTFENKVVAIGELGLSGEVRTVGHLELRLKEAKRLGFDTVLIPEVKGLKAPEGLKVIRVNKLGDAVDLLM